MAEADNIPPIPMPEQTAGAVPPVEPAPVVPAAPAQGLAAPAYPPPPVYAPAVYAPGPPRGLSIASLVCGIGGLLLSFVGLGFLPSLAAVITGHLAQGRQKDARPLWLAGVITGWIGIGIALLWGIFWVVVIVLAIVHGTNSGTTSYGYYNT